MRRSISSLLILFLLLTNAFALIASSPELVDAVEPYVAHLKLKPEHLRALADKLAVARALPSDNDKEMAAVGVAMADATPDAYVESYKTLATFQQNPYIVASGRFGDKPESFIYWAKQKFGDLKPVINVVHFLIHHDGNRVYIASKQLYSTHYTEAGLSVAELIPFADGQGQARTIVIYTIRLQVDMLGGSFGFMKKRLAQPRILGTLRASLNGMRLTMERLSGTSLQNRGGS
ncbi:MAG: hypothetical protein WAV47_04660 [Blastocatellia bacterium]